MVFSNQYFFIFHTVCRHIDSTNKFTELEREGGREGGREGERERERRRRRVLLQYMCTEAKVAELSSWPLSCEKGINKVFEINRLIIKKSKDTMTKHDITNNNDFNNYQAIRLLIIIIVVIIKITER